MIGGVEWTPSIEQFGLQEQLPKHTMDRLWEYIANAKKKPISLNHELAGNISSSLGLTDTDNWFFDQSILPMIRKLSKKLDMLDVGYRVFKSGVQPSVPFCLSDFWVNFQKQHEFQPLHSHSGCFSFAIFMKIPYNWREQHAIPHQAAASTPCAGNFQFAVNNVLGKLMNVVFKLDSSWEGTILFFPAEMQHQVFPFYNCEEERITISGNIVYDI